MAPIVDGLKAEYEGTVEFRLYDVEKDAEGSELATKFGAQYVPTFVFVNSDGSVAGQVVGESTVEVMREKLDALN